MIEKIRTFNRLYLANMGFMNRDYLGSGYSIAESRVLFELKYRHFCIQNDLTKALNIDKGYLSRIINKFEKKNLIKKQPSETDRRSSILSLSEKGEQTINTLIALSNKHIMGMIVDISSDKYQELSDALELVSALLF